MGVRETIRRKWRGALSYVQPKGEASSYWGAGLLDGIRGITSPDDYSVWLSESLAHVKAPPSSA